MLHATLNEVFSAAATADWPALSKQTTSNRSTPLISVSFTTPYSSRAQYHQSLGHRHPAPLRATHLKDNPVHGCRHGQLHLHRLDHHQMITGPDALTDRGGNSPDASRDRAGHGYVTLLHLLDPALEMRRRQFRGISDLTTRFPPSPLRLEGRLLARLVSSNIRAIVCEEAPVILQAECLLADVELHAAMQKIIAEFQQLFAAHRIEADLIEETQQPRHIALKFPRHVIGVPHLAGTPDELISSGAFHAVDAQIGTADAHRVLRGPGSRRVVLGGDQAVPWIDGGRDGRAQID